MRWCVCARVPVAWCDVCWIRGTCVFACVFLTSGLNGQIVCVYLSWSSFWLYEPMPFKHLMSVPQMCLHVCKALMPVVSFGNSSQWLSAKSRLKPCTGLLDSIWKAAWLAEKQSPNVRHKKSAFSINLCAIFWKCNLLQTKTQPRIFKTLSRVPSRVQLHDLPSTHVRAKLAQSLSAPS